ncbi:hypothetical protein [Synechococcus sp. PCC 6312]|uniref:primosomal protein N' family DNA-binding protein n=1 Tax=Synechococcus sp. (strain ATCC 27167 / PCC 6312) TaxID=195253 RepID=UPI0002DC3C05|nr:hypothetical protein [Synechococcus sp. PCC 6312]
MSCPPWLNVLLDCPGNSGAFTYAQPPGLSVHPGDLVNVPLGPGQVGGIVLGSSEHLPPGLTPEQIRPINEVIQLRFFSSTYWQLLERTAAYYYTPLVQVLRTALPQASGTGQGPDKCSDLKTRSLPRNDFADKYTVRVAGHNGLGCV